MLVLGSEGFIGQEFCQFFKLNNIPFIATSKNGSEQTITFSLSQPNFQILTSIRDQYDCVIFLAAKTNVRWCEMNVNEANLINVTNAIDTLKFFVGLNKKIIYFSSDYVFDGYTGNYGDDSLKNAKTVYGKGKQLLEELIPKITNNYLIIRLGKVFGTKPEKKCLISEIANTLYFNEIYSAAYDQVFSTICVHDIPKIILFFNSQELNGLFNICSKASFSRYQIAQIIREILGVNENLLKKINLRDLPFMSDRPLNTSMTPTNKLAEYNFQLTDIRQAIEIVSDKLKSSVNLRDN